MRLRLFLARHEKRRNMETKGKIGAAQRKALCDLVCQGNWAEACRRLEPFARQGNANAQYELGKLLFDLMEEKQDYSDIGQVVDWYAQAGRQHHVGAMIALGDLYLPACAVDSEGLRKARQSPSFRLEADLNKSLALYEKACEWDEDSLPHITFSKLLCSRQVDREMKDEAVKMLLRLARKGNREAAWELLFQWNLHLKFPDRFCCSLELASSELLHADWFRLLLEREVQQAGEGGREGIKTLGELAEGGNEEALRLLTDIGIKIGGSVAASAGDIHYVRKEYEVALSCFLRADRAYGILGRMYERGEGTAPDARKAFSYYARAKDYANLGRMYEQGFGTEKDLQKAFDCYQKVIDRKIYGVEDEEYKNEIFSVRRSFRRLKKALFPQKDEVRLRVCLPQGKADCAFVVGSYEHCCLTIDWGDGATATENVNNTDGGDITFQHTYTKRGCWNICVKSDEACTITSFRYASDGDTLKKLDLTRCPVITDVYCVGQSLQRLNVFRNIRLERLVCRGNGLSTLNIRSNHRLTRLDCSGNPLVNLRWHPRYSALLRLCMKDTRLPEEQKDRLRWLLARNKGKETGTMQETPAEPVRPRLSYYLRCCSWKEMKNEIRNDIISGKTYTWKKHEQIFKDVCSRDADDHHGKWEIVCDGWVHFASSDCVQDLQKVYLSVDEWLSTPVNVVEKEGWMMLPLTKPAEIAGPCMAAMIEQTEPRIWQNMK